MDVVGILLTVVLLLVIPIGFLLGMINPNWVRMVGRPQVFFRFSAMGFGCVVLLIIVALLSPKDSDVPTTSEATDTKQNESYESKDLSWFIEQDAGERRNVVNGLMAAAKLDGKESEAFYTCLSDYASSKSKELSVAQVFGWCEREFNSEPAKFRDHFNELDAKDESVMGYLMCKRLVETQLLSPSTADFPFTSDGSWSMGRQRYVYKLHVDSQNAYGAMVRTNWHCDVQYKGLGESADINNWTLHKLEQQ
ncbi:hypothetical protein [Aeromonas finlandensis]|uniref:hypothetical protein n=1 Tax=Aeromonas finlandensis TaxID=1543375 RepID=UPI00051BE226|nr:hypothetical protein [Aeromonas finlandensis]